MIKIEVLRRLLTLESRKYIVELFYELLSLGEVNGLAMDKTQALK